MRILLLLLLFLMQSACGGDTGPEQNAATSEAEEPHTRPPEFILAGIDGPGAGEDVSRLRLALDAITAKCNNDPREITEAIVEIKGILDKKGIEISTLELMQRLEQNIPERSDGSGYDFAEVIVSFRHLSPQPASR